MSSSYETSLGHSNPKPSIASVDSVARRRVSIKTMIKKSGKRATLSHTAMNFEAG